MTVGRRGPRLKRAVCGKEQKCGEVAGVTVRSGLGEALRRESAGSPHSCRQTSCGQWVAAPKGAGCVSNLLLWPLLRFNSHPKRVCSQDAAFYVLLTL